MAGILAIEVKAKRYFFLDGPGFWYIVQGKYGANAGNDTGATR